MAGFTSGIANTLVQRGAGGAGHYRPPTGINQISGPVSTMPTMTPQQAPQSSFKMTADADRPWEYDFQAMDSSQKPQGIYGGVAGGQYNIGSGHFGGEQVGYGPQGYGKYIYHSPAENAVRAKQFYLKRFQDSLPQLNNELSGNLMNETGKAMYGQTHQSKAGMAKRGMLHSGMAAGQEAGIKANAAKGFAQGKQSINQGLIDAEGAMQDSAAKVGFDWQKQQQDYENAIYQNALKAYSANQQVLGGMAQTGTMAAIMLA